MKRGAAEPSSHHLARMTQIEYYGSSHFGSGGIATFHQEFVCYDIIIFTINFYQNIINSILSLFFKESSGWPCTVIK